MWEAEVVRINARMREFGNAGMGGVERNAGMRECANALVWEVEGSARVLECSNSLVLESEGKSLVREFVSALVGRFETGNLKLETLFEHSRIREFAYSRISKLRFFGGVAGGGEHGDAVGREVGLEHVFVEKGLLDAIGGFACHGDDQAALGDELGHTDAFKESAVKHGVVLVAYWQIGFLRHPLPQDHNRRSPERFALLRCRIKGWIAAFKVVEIGAPKAVTKEKKKE